MSFHPSAVARPPRSRWWGVAALVMAGSAALAACGSSVGTGSAAGSSGSSTTSGSAAANGGSPGSSTGVAVVLSDVTAQMVTAAPQVSSHSDEATFTLHALTASGQAAAGQPVSWWVGPMVPLSGVHPAHWFEAGTAAAKPYVASAATTTDASGQARIVLFGQPAKAMEMVAVRVGDLNSYDMAAGHGVGLLDAWWTTPSTTPTAPVGDRVTVSPFLAATHPGERTVFQVHVTDASGDPIVGAGVDWVPQPVGGTAAMGSSMGSSSMTSASMGSSSMTSSTAAMGGDTSSAPVMTPTMAVTNAAGDASYSFQRSDHGTYCGLRVVVTQPGAKTRVAGGMAGELLTPS